MQACALRASAIACSAADSISSCFWPATIMDGSPQARTARSSSRRAESSSFPACVTVIVFQSKEAERNRLVSSELELRKEKPMGRFRLAKRDHAAWSPLQGHAIRLGAKTNHSLRSIQPALLLDRRPQALFPVNNLTSCQLHMNSLTWDNANFYPCNDNGHTAKRRPIFIRRRFRSLIVDAPEVPACCRFEIQAISGPSCTLSVIPRSVIPLTRFFLLKGRL